MFHSAGTSTSPQSPQEKLVMENREDAMMPFPSNSLGVVSRSFIVAKSPSEHFPYTNCLGVHRSDFPKEFIHVLVNDTFLLTIRYDTSKESELEPGCVGVSLAQRQWIGITEGSRVTIVELSHLDVPLPIRQIEIELDFLKRGYQNVEPYLADDMIIQFINEYKGILMTDRQPILFKYHGEKLRGIVSSLAIELPGSPASSGTGVLTGTTYITFVSAQDSAMQIIPSTRQDHSLALHPQTTTAEHLGIGGLDNEFDRIRRVLSSYALTSVTADQLRIHHVRGILLYGPPGTGKSLIVSQLGKLLGTLEPKIADGYDLVGKSASATWEVIRSWFSDAEKEYQTRGPTSRLHIIVIDHLDAICKRHGPNHETDSPVNQIISKMDHSGPNVLFVGTANDLGNVDGALLRPERLEVHVEIPLPNEGGRYQILNIHTSHMRSHGVIDGDVNLQEIAHLTTNFSGVDISSLIRCATGFALDQHTGAPTDQGVRIKRDDFIHALQEVRPAFGVSDNLQDVFQNDIIPYDHIVNEILKSAKLVVEQVRTSKWTPCSSMLFYGPSGSGKTALAASIARNSGYPFIRFISPDDMVGYSETQKIAELTKSLVDSQTSVLSVIVIDDIERLIDWSPRFGTYSNAILQVLLVLFKRRPPKGRRLLTIATASTTILSDLGFPKTFSSELLVPPISSLAPVDKVLTELALFPSDRERQQAITMIEKRKVFPKSRIGIKDLLNIIEMARQEQNNIAERLVMSLLKWKESVR